MDGAPGLLWRVKRRSFDFGYAFAQDDNQVRLSASQEDRFWVWVESLAACLL